MLHYAQSLEQSLETQVHLIAGHVSEYGPPANKSPG